MSGQGRAKAGRRECGPRRAAPPELARREPRSPRKAHMSQTRSWMAVPALAAGVLLLAGAPAFAADTATIYDVSQEGLTSAEGQKLADSFGIPNGVADNGAFTYTGKEFGAVPQKQAGGGRDESGRPTLSSALDLRALESIRPLSDKAALSRAAQLPGLAGLGGDFRAAP